MKKVKHQYGWVPDVPDQRDYFYQAIRPALELPAVIDLRAGCSPVEDQGRLGSCTANALAGSLEFLDVEGDHVYTDVSRLFIYYNERAMRGLADSDSGATLRDGIKTLAKQGVCPEKDWPYEVSKFAQRPPAPCYVEALERRIISYHRLQTLSDMLVCLADGYPFVFGFAVYESFESPAVAKSGIVPMPKANERFLGGHAVTAVGYDQKERRFMVRNSWGPRWGRQGYCTMPFAYLESLARDFWTIRK